MNSHRCPSINAIAMLLFFSAGLGESLLAHSNEGSANPKAPESKTGQSPDTLNWKIYSNAKYGFQVKYPKTWAIHPGTGSGTEVVTLAGAFRGSGRASLNLAIQPNKNPRALSVDEWFADQLRVSRAKPETTGQLTIGGQPAIWMENANSFGKRHDTFTLLHKTDVLSFSYKPGTADEPIYIAIIESFRMLK